MVNDKITVEMTPDEAGQDATPAVDAKAGTKPILPWKK
jgi:hypothetical protein